jgi:chemosensory pili system protein ChpA (sensor histidine kinase/response regulator)
MQFNETSVDLDPTVIDLGPLAWVLDELRKSLDGAIKALRRFVRDADLALGSDLAALDTSHLRIARQQLHQAEGALEMVGLGAPASVLRAMEAVVQKFVQRPELCTQDHAAKVERASFALIEYLDAVLRSKPTSPVALFPQYGDLQEMVGAARIHPADLWPVEWRWIDIELDNPSSPMDYNEVNRHRFDQAMLKVIKTGDPVAAKKLQVLCLGLAAAQSARQPRIFWTICAAYFEALTGRWCPNDVYVKRTSSGVLTQYIAMARLDLTRIDRLAHELLFFCAQAGSRVSGAAPTLMAVLQAYGLQGEGKPVDYQTRLFGRFDPAVLVQARKRIGVAKEMWAALSGGDTQKLKAAADQFSLISDSLIKLDPASHSLAQALTRVMEATVRSGQVPTPQVAMEVATSVLYLEAAYDEIDPEDSQLATRSERLAQRLDNAHLGAEPQALEPWMEDLYRKVSERQTMGSVVGELGVTMGSLEKAMDQFFRDPSDKSTLQQVPGQLAQMRGVLSLLGLDQASQAVLYMRDSVEQILVDEVDEERAKAAGTFDRLGNSLGALGFMVDMLNYQPTLAKKLFVFDQNLGEFRSIMGRAPVAQTAVAAQIVAPEPEVLAEPSFPVIADLPNEAAAVVSPVTAPVAAVSASVEEDDAELREIFLEEAREVLESGLDTLSKLAVEPEDMGLQATLRRAFHTLKGSARMVGLNEYGEAAWSLEQLLNSWIAEQHALTDAVRGVSTDGLLGLQAWVNDIAAGTDAPWRSEPFRAMADALRLENRRVPLALPDSKLLPSLQTLSDGEPLQQPDQDLGLEIPLTSSDELLNGPVALSPSEPVSNPDIEGLDLIDFDFGALADVSDTAELSIAAPTLATTAPPELEQTDVPVADIDFDFDSLDLPELPSAAVSAPQTPTLDEIAELVELESEPDPDSEPEEEVKVIGSLRIGIPLYNVYLNEADEWSRRLVTELTEWALESHQPIADSTVALAHSLAGSSATVGFMQLSSLARELELALEHVQLMGMRAHQAGQAQTFTDAAQEVRRLLHQFAAGFVKDADPQLTQALKDVRDVEIVDFTVAGDSARIDQLAAEEVAVEVADELPEAAHVESAQVWGADVVAEIAPELEPEPRPEPIEEVLTGFAGLGAVASSALLTPITPAFDAHAQEIDVQDAIDPDLFPIFEEEALGLLPGLAGALRQWSARPANTGARAEVLRALHTLKGSARLAGAMQLGEMAHRIESSVEALSSEGLQSSQIEPLLAHFDDMQAHFDDLRRAEAAILGVTPVPAVAAASEPVVVAGTPAPMPPLKPTAVAATLAAAFSRASSQQSVRVRPQLLDRLVNQAGEVVMTRSRLEAGLGQLGGALGDLTGNLDRLRQQLRDIEFQAETQMQSRLAQSKDSAQGFDPLEFDRFTRVQELTRMMAESVNDVATVQRSLQRAVESTEDNLVAQARQTRELQRDLLRTRMVEFESIAERLYGVVRQASKDTGKQVRLDIVGGSIEIDRSVLDRMTPAFEHLLRNCVGHGIEDPATRVAAGKDASGTVTIRLNQDGNDVAVEFVDDGAGLDIKGIREKALAMGLLTPDQVVTDAQVANYIFAPGISTAAQVTEMAGRGIGMDVVRTEVSALGGRIETESEAGKGTRFHLILPLTTAVTQIVILRAGKLTVGVPAGLVEMVRRVKAPLVSQAYSSGFFDEANVAIPFFWSGALLQASPRSQELDAKTLSVVIFRSAGQRVALHVDEVLGHQEVVVKNLGAQLARLPGLAAMTVLTSGAVVLIYNPVVLATVYGEDARALAAKDAQREAAADAAGQSKQTSATDTLAHQKTPLVLVVDDSITVRRVTQRLLMREGYRVALAVDGLQALERLQEELPAVVLTDIEMPRMDGFDLTRNIRGDVRMRDIPIIMITSRIADKHRQHAEELGVNHYLGKPYPEEELLDLVRNFCAEELVSQAT